MRSDINVYFKARWGASLQISTLLWLIVIASLLAFSYQKMPLEHAYQFGAIVVAFTLWNLLSCVRGYRIRGHTIEIIRPLWTTRINASKLRKIRLDPNAMQGSIPVFANMGFFSFNGWFHSERHGMFRAYVTDRACVVRVRIGHQGPLLMFSPEEPEHFLRVLREATRNGDKPSQFSRKRLINPENAAKPNPQAQS